MTTKTKTQKAKVEPKVQATKTVVETQPKVSTSEQKKSFKLPTFKNNMEKPCLYRLIKSGKNRKTGKSTYPVAFMIKAEDVIYDPETNLERTIRYIPGESSIYKDEQSKEVRLREPIMFNNGILTVPPTNPMLKKYLELCNANRSNPNRISTRAASFYKVDTEVNASKNVSKAKAEIDALQLALNMPMEQLVGYAKVLGVNTNNSVDEIRWDMKMLAQKDPNSFISGLSDPTTEIKEILLKAQEHNIIRMSGNKISWLIGGSEQLISHVPIGIKAIDKMVDFCLSGDGKIVYDEIKLKLVKFA